jgi:hypothetical protein
MTVQSIAPEFAELSPSEAQEIDGGIVFVAALLLPWMGAAFAAGVTLGVAAATVYFATQD